MTDSTDNALKPLGEWQVWPSPVANDDRADLAPTPLDARVAALIAATKGFVTASYRGTAHTHLVEAREGVMAALAAFNTTGGKDE